MLRRTPRSTGTDTRFPYTTRFLSWPLHFNLSEKRLFRCRPVSPPAVIAPAGGAGHRSGHKLRVETLVKPVHRPVQMRPGGAAGGAHRADPLAPAHPFAAPHVHARQMQIGDRKIVG